MMFKDNPEGQTHFADDATLAYIAELERLVAVQRKMIENVETVAGYYEESSSMCFQCPWCDEEMNNPNTPKHKQGCELKAILDGTQQTALAYENRIKAQALREAATLLDITPRGQFPEEQLLRMADELEGK